MGRGAVKRRLAARSLYRKPNAWCSGAIQVGATTAGPPAHGASGILGWATGFHGWSATAAGSASRGTRPIIAAQHVQGPIVVEVVVRAERQRPTGGGGFKVARLRVARRCAVIEAGGRAAAVEKSALNVDAVVPSAERRAVKGASQWSSRAEGPPHCGLARTRTLCGAHRKSVCAASGPFVRQTL